MAGRLLSARAPTARRAGLCGRGFHEHRDQRIVLFAAATGVLFELVSGDAQWVRVRGEGAALHHAHAQAEGLRARAGELFASGVFKLREKLGPILWQLPPNLLYDAARLESFLALLPQDTEVALSLARKRARWMKGRTCLTIEPARRIRHALEFRHPSFLQPSLVKLLHRYRTALVVAETAGLWPQAHDVTADFMYLRLHGDREIYRSGYSRQALSRWAKRIRAWHSGSEPAEGMKIAADRKPARRMRDVYCYFDNTDAKLRAPFDARSLMRDLELESGAEALDPWRAPQRPPAVPAAL